jgi:3-isopropylmalate/(R)-2-methylmalate dehydratase large subunit
VPNKDIPSAEQAKIMRVFAGSRVSTTIEVGEMGIEHVILPENRYRAAGESRHTGADSHTCTYGAIGAFFHTVWVPPDIEWLWPPEISGDRFHPP